MVILLNVIGAIVYLALAVLLFRWTLKCMLDEYGGIDLEDILVSAVIALLLPVGALIAFFVFRREWLEEKLTDWVSK